MSYQDTNFYSVPYYKATVSELDGKYRCPESTSIPSYQRIRNHLLHSLRLMAGHKQYSMAYKILILHYPE